MYIRLSSKGLFPHSILTSYLVSFLSRTFRDLLRRVLDSRPSTAALLESTPLQKIEFSTTSTAAPLYMPVAHLFLLNQFIWYTTPINICFNRTVNTWVFSTQPTGI